MEGNKDLVYVLVVRGKKKFLGLVEDGEFKEVYEECLKALDEVDKHITER